MGDYYIVWFCLCYLVSIYSPWDKIINESWDSTDSIKDGGKSAQVI